MKFLDISLPLEAGMVVWPGDVGFARRESRGSAIVSVLRLSSHHGTHIDAPRHFLFNSKTVDRIALSKLIGAAQVLEVRSQNLIEVADLKAAALRPHDKILFKTRNAQLYLKKHFDPNYVSLSLAAARYLARKKIDLVGIDYYGIEAKNTPGHPVHKVLMRAGIVIVEGLNLAKVKAGKYNLAVLPLMIKAGDAAPARAVLWK